MKRSWLALIVLVFSAGTVAAEDPAQTLRNDPKTYPFVSYFDWLGSPARDAQDPSLGPYNFDAGILGIEERAVERYPQHYGASRLTDCQGLDCQSLQNEIQTAVDSVTHVRPTVPYAGVWGDAGHPAYMPDWNGNGDFGDSGDFDLDIDETLDEAPFRYPCPMEDGSVRYENTDGQCVDAASSVIYKLGTAREMKIVDSRGLLLDATLWIPGEAPPVAGYPGVVFSNGIASRQDYYYWLAMRFARAGYLVLTYDPAGQGQSEGGASELFDPFDQTDQAIKDCEFGGACRDLQDVARWFVGDDVMPIANLGASNDPLAPATYQEELFQQSFSEQQSNYSKGRIRSPYVSRKNPAYAADGDNVENPVLDSLDKARIALAGNSMGAMSTLNYLNYFGNGGIGADGNALPPVQAALVLSGAAATRAVVPIQFQTSDYDGSPILVGPTAFGLFLGGTDPRSLGQPQGIGYAPIKDVYDKLRDGGFGDAPLSLLVLEGGVHTDHVTVPFVPRAVWANHVAGEAAVDWLDCHVRKDQAACADAIADRDHLSRAFASEQTPMDERGTNASQCIRVPDRASLNQSPASFVQAYVLGESVCDCQATPPGQCTPPLAEP